MVNFPKDVSNATVAFYFLIGLEAGIFKDDCAKEWAFNIVGLSDNPPIDIIEVATANLREDVFANLNNVAGERDTRLAGSWLLAYLHDYIQSHPNSTRRVVQKAMQVSRSTSLPDDVYYAFDLIDDELSLAENGTFGTVEQSRAELVSALAEFGTSPVVET
jgi:hypothetical protein